MELFSLVGIVIFVVLLVAALRLIVHSAKFVFYSLLVILTVVFFFGISYTDVLDWSLDILLWVF